MKDFFLNFFGAIRILFFSSLSILLTLFIQLFEDNVSVAALLNNGEFIIISVGLLVSAITILKKYDRPTPTTFYHISLGLYTISLVIYVLVRVYNSTPHIDKILLYSSFLILGYIIFILTYSRLLESGADILSGRENDLNKLKNRLKNIKGGQNE